MSRKRSNVNLHCDKMFHCKIRMCFGDDFGGLQTAKRSDNNNCMILVHYFNCRMFSFFDFFAVIFFAEAKNRFEITWFVFLSLKN